MLEEAYRPSGWLGIMCVALPAARRLWCLPALGAVSRSRGGCGDTRRLGSRLYFEFTAAALSDGAAWEGLADGVAVEVRRHGAPTAPAPAEAAAHGVVGEVAAPPTAVPAPAALAAAAPPATREVSAPGAAGGVSSVVHIDNSNSSTTNNNINRYANTVGNNNNNNNNNNNGNTSIVLL